MNWREKNIFKVLGGSALELSFSLYSCEKALKWIVKSCKAPPTGISMVENGQISWWIEKECFVTTFPRVPLLCWAGKLSLWIDGRRWRTSQRWPRGHCQPLLEFEQRESPSHHDQLFITLFSWTSEMSCWMNSDFNLSTFFSYLKCCHFELFSPRFSARCEKFCESSFRDKWEVNYS